jgi:hypothetical protein
MNSACINSLGLIFDIVGALLLWYFVPEIDLLDKAALLKGRATLVLADPNQQQVNAYKRRVRLSRAGVILLVLGFILQLVSNYAGRWHS